MSYQKHNLILAECVISIEEGWQPIVRRACEQLLARGYTISQVKEKFAGLRIYYEPWSEEGDDIVSAAEAQASAHCEDCGTTDDVATRGRYWIKRLCPTCAGARWGDAWKDAPEEDDDVV